VQIIDKSFLSSPRSYITQSIFAVATLAIILYFVEVLTHAAVVAALDASTFIVFAMPHSITAQPRRLIGGHVVGLLCGSLCHFAFLTGPLGRLIVDWEFLFWLVSALSVGLSIFLMTITNTEHPPAASAALGLAAHEWSNQVVIFIILCAICLAITGRLLRRYLRDLL